MATEFTTLLTIMICWSCPTNDSIDFECLFGISANWKLERTQFFVFLSKIVCWALRYTSELNTLFSLFRTLLAETTWHQLFYYISF